MGTVDFATCEWIEDSGFLRYQFTVFRSRCGEDPEMGVSLRSETYFQESVLSISGSYENVYGISREATSAEFQISETIS